VSAEIGRNHTVDVTRALSVLIVVVFHGLLYTAHLTLDGSLYITQWSPPSWVFFASWLLMAMPAFFVCGGFANALIVDKMYARGTGFSHYLANRGRRLTGGLTLFVTFFAVVASVAGWLGFFDYAYQASTHFMRLLWFISVYLVIVLFAPFLVRLHDRFGAWVLVVFMVAIVIVDRGVFGHQLRGLGELNMFLVWPLCHQLGIGYQRGWFRTGPVARTWVQLGLAAGGIAVLVFLFGYPPSAVGFGNMPVANHLPPTLAMALLGVAQAAVMGLVERSGVLRNMRPRTEKLVGTINALAMTIYLWHIPCLAIGGMALLTVSTFVPSLSWLLLSQALVIAAGLAVLSVVAPAVGWVEFKLIPQLGEQQDRDLALLSFCVMIAGSMLVWNHGAMFDVRAPLSTVGVLSLWVGAVLMVRASRPAGVARSTRDTLKLPRRR